MVGVSYGTFGLFFPGLVKDAGMEIDVPMIQKWAPFHLIEWQPFLEFLANSSNPENLDLFCPGVATHFAKLHMRDGLDWKVKTLMYADGSVDDETRIANWMRLASI